MSGARERTLMWVGFAAGLALRCALLFDKGTYDMFVFESWGRWTLERGLARGYVGAYFPLSYQIFALCQWMVDTWHVNQYAAFKAVTLIFDAGTFVLIVAFLRRLQARSTWALLYWLHPWFLTVFELGYVDSQFTFLLLLTLWLTDRAVLARQWAGAGIPLAAALLMKPQVMLIAFGVAVYLWFRSHTTRDWRPWALMAPAVVLLAAYEVYFAVALWPGGALQAVLELPVSFVRVGSIMPVLSADMLNVWYPLAAALKQPGTAIWTVSSKIELIPHVQLRFVALLITLAVIVWYARVVALERTERRPSGLYFVVMFIGLAVPMLMTSSHENHLFLPTVLFVPWLATRPGRAVAVAVQGTLAIQCVNLEAMYGVDRLVPWMRQVYTLEIRVGLAVLSFAFAAVLALAMRRRFNQLYS